MRIRRIAILIDGGFFIKRLPHIVGETKCNSPRHVAEWARRLCQKHVEKLVGRTSSKDCHWLDHVYRLFYYDALPYDGVAHHPVENRQIHYAKTPEALFRNELFRELRTKRKFALRLGQVVREDGWHINSPDTTKKLLRTQECLHLLDAAVRRAETGDEIPALTDEQVQQIKKTTAVWRGLKPSDIRLGLRQKGVDMRIGVDISTLTLKKQVDTIILVTGDSDFVPAAKVARREGVEVILDPLGQSVKDDLNEHVDGVFTVLRRGRLTIEEPELPSEEEA